MKKRTWCKPDLVVIQRALSEESVLAGCKLGRGGPTDSYSGCQQGPPYPCAYCREITGS
jgi:hypothetical protein